MGKDCKVLLSKCMEVLNRSMSVNASSVFKDLDVATTLSTIHCRTLRQSLKQHCFCLQNARHPMFIIGGRRRK